MQLEKRGSERQTEETTAAYLTSIARRYRYKTILAQFIDDVQDGYCLDCGLVHSFVNIDLARNRYQQQQNKTHKDLAHLFWEAAL
jgi:hypothetical protein